MQHDAEGPFAVQIMVTCVCTTCMRFCCIKLERLCMRYVAEVTFAVQIPGNVCMHHLR